MAWVRRRDPIYEMMLTDGYISPPSGTALTARNPGKTIEAIMAERFFRLNKKPRGPLGHREVPNPLHIWVIGNENWLNLPAAKTPLFQNIHENEKDDRYRVFIVGSAWPEGGYIGDWKGWLWQAGMRKKKRHSDTMKLKEYGGTILELMSDHYCNERKAPSKVLDRLGVPYTFHGD